MRALRGQLHASLAGMVVGIGFLCLSLTPSLLPRTWLVQGLISGISTATGYAIGTLAGRLVPVRPGPRVRRALWYALLVSGVPVLLTLAWQSTRWQRQLHALMGEPVPDRAGYLRAELLGWVVFAALVAAARGVRAIVREVGQVLAWWLPARSARPLGGVMVALISLVMLDAAVYDPGVSVAVATSQWVNDGLSAQVSAPASMTRSGGPGSAVSWASLGRQGRAFVAGGPTLDQLRSFARAPVRPPVRVYVGLGSAPDLRARAALAVRELVRTGGFGRQVLCVTTTTGTGWVDPGAAAALEYLYRGDTAQVAIQYSVLPSWLSYLLERTKAEAAGRELFNQVYAYWSTLPPDRRPKLLLFGESLGSFGGEAALADDAAVPDFGDLTGRVDGILWAGRRSDRPARSLAGAPGGVPPARLRPGHLVVAGAAGAAAGLAARAARPGPATGHAVVPVRDVLAGHGRSGVRRGRPARARPPVRRRAGRRLGGDRATARLDRVGHPAAGPAGRHPRLDPPMA